MSYHGKHIHLSHRSSSSLRRYRVAWLVVNFHCALIIIALLFSLLMPSKADAELYTDQGPACASFTITGSLVTCDYTDTFDNNVTAEVLTKDLVDIDKLADWVRANVTAGSSLDQAIRETLGFCSNRECAIDHMAMLGAKPSCGGAEIHGCCNFAVAVECVIQAFNNSSGYYFRFKSTSPGSAGFTAGAMQGCVLTNETGAGEGWSYITPGSHFWSWRAEQTWTCPAAATDIDSLADFLVASEVNFRLHGQNFMGEVIGHSAFDVTSPTDIFHQVPAPDGYPCSQGVVLCDPVGPGGPTPPGMVSGPDETEGDGTGDDVGDGTGDEWSDNIGECDPNDPAVISLEKDCADHDDDAGTADVDLSHITDSDEIKNFEVDVGGQFGVSGFLPASCPQPVTWAVMGASGDISFQYACDFASSIRGLVIAVGAISAMIIATGGATRTA